MKCLVVSFAALASYVAFAAPVALPSKAMPEEYWEMERKLAKEGWSPQNQPGYREPRKIRKFTVGANAIELIADSKIEDKWYSIEKMIVVKPMETRKVSIDLEFTGEDATIEFDRGEKLTTTLCKSSSSTVALAKSKAILTFSTETYERRIFLFQKAIYVVSKNEKSTFYRDELRTVVFMK